MACMPLARSALCSIELSAPPLGPGRLSVVQLGSGRSAQHVEDAADGVHRCAAGTPILRDCASVAEGIATRRAGGQLLYVNDGGARSAAWGLSRVALLPRHARCCSTTAPRSPPFRPLQPGTAAICLPKLSQTLASLLQTVVPAS